MNAEELFIGLNDRQREAVECTEGPLLVLAGAGSGKTKILTHRIGYLIATGAAPWNILAITFTNKAAREMRERTDRLLGTSQAQYIFVSTFHSMCVRLLRYDIDRLGYGRDFTIYDTDDQRTLIRSCIKQLKLDTKMYKDRAMLSFISSMKNEMTTAEECADAAADFYEKNAAKVYAEYERQLKENNALDFDDLLIKTVDLFRRFPDVLERWQERFRYIMVDEYQDTNNVQFELVRLLAMKYGNLCVVGDDDQSIYKFRGANIENILSFEKTFPGARVVKLEQNYRSTKSILNAANEVIRNNKGRKDKRLWTENEGGELPVFDEYVNAASEADGIVRKALLASRSGLSLKDQAVLYRTNAQSRLLEEKCVQLNIPYVIVGGVNFYQRKEIKDILSYLRVISNGVDDLACRRIINVPKRGIGQTSVDKISAYAEGRGISFYDALGQCDSIPGLGAAAAKKVSKFRELIESFRVSFAENENIRALIEQVRDESGYADELKNDDPVSAETRLENIEELINKAVSYEEEQTALISPSGAGDRVNQAAEAQAGAAEAAAAVDAMNHDGRMIQTGSEQLETSDIAGSDSTNSAFAALSMFLEDISLVSDIDRTNTDNEALTMMTLHAAKGLEFDTVYLCGMEEGLFPSSAAINSADPDADIEEERRLCYVGFTRAMRRLYLSASCERMINGETHRMKPSRFIDELPDEASVKHFTREHDPSRRGRESFAGFGGYEGRMEYGYSHSGSYEYGGSSKSGSYGRDDYGRSAYRNDDGYGRSQYAGDSYSSDRSSGRGYDSGYDMYGASAGSRSREEASYSAYNSFDSSRAGRFGSLDPTPAGRARKKKDALSGLSGIKGIGKGMGAVKQKPDYAVGDRVIHTKFGIGTVLSIEEETKDYKVAVEFDEHGRKAMYAGFAKLRKI